MPSPLWTLQTLYQTTRCFETQMQARITFIMQGKQASNCFLRILASVIIFDLGHSLIVHVTNFFGFLSFCSLNKIMFVFSVLCVLRVLDRAFSESMRTMRGGFFFRSRGPSLKIHHRGTAGENFAVCPVMSPRLRIINPPRIERIERIQ
jgi:hypothetical protein